MVTHSNESVLRTALEDLSDGLTLKSNIDIQSLMTAPGAHTLPTSPATL